jgi:hypothetical protein
MGAKGSKRSCSLGENRWRQETFQAGSATDMIKPSMLLRHAAAIRQNVTGV